jgi:hypothetical protein
MTVATERTDTETSIRVAEPTAEWEAPTLAKLPLAAAESGVSSTIDAGSYS